MDIKEFKNPMFVSMQETWNELEASETSPFYLSHYDLAAYNSKFTAHEWKQFLTEPNVVDYINAEVRLMYQTKMRLLIKGLDNNSKSTGTPQAINAIHSILEKTPDEQKTGPIFVYCMVPLSSQELHAKNVKVLEENPFDENFNAVKNRKR